MDNKLDYWEYNIGDIGPLGKKIKEIIIVTNNIIVYLDVDDDIQWATVNYSIAYHSDFGEIQNKVYYWESMVNKLFSVKDSYDYKCLLAGAVARILDDRNPDFANKIIDQTVLRIEKHGKEILKQNYLISAFLFTVIIMTILFFSVIFRNELLLYFSNEIFHIIIISLFGGVGAFVFVVLRLKTYIPDIAIGKRIHRIDGYLRVFYGLVLGLIVAIAIKSNIVLGFINEISMTLYLKAFLGIVAGASEVFIPNLIKQVEEKS